MARRQYSDQDRASALAALDANGGNVAKTAKDVGVPRVTLIQWRDGVVSQGVSELRQVKKGDLADRLEEIAHKLVEAIPGKIGSAPLKEVAVALGIAVEKSRLLREKPTSITQETVSEDERKRRTLELLGRGESRAGTQLPDGRGTGGVGLPAVGQPAVN